MSGVGPRDLVLWSLPVHSVSISPLFISPKLIHPGLIMMAGCNNVETYCAAQVFYWVGYDGMLYVLTVFVADTSSLKNRAMMFAYTTSPYIVTAWIGGPVSTSFLGGAGWRWAYGTFAIVVPVVSAPLIILFTYNLNKAKRVGLLPEREKNRTFFQSLKYYAIEFDCQSFSLFPELLLTEFSCWDYIACRWPCSFPPSVQSLHLSNAWLALGSCHLHDNIRRPSPHLIRSI